MQEQKNHPDNHNAKRRAEEEEDFYSSGGFVALTEEYLLQRGYCCGNGCINCPYDYKAVPEPRRSLLLAKRNQNK